MLTSGTAADLQVTEVNDPTDVSANGSPDALVVGAIVPGGTAGFNISAGGSGGYVDSSLTNPSEAPPPIVQDDAGAYVPPSPENVDPYQGSYTAPSSGGYYAPPPEYYEPEPSYGTGDAPGISGPPSPGYGPDFTSPGNENYFS